MKNFTNILFSTIITSLFITSSAGALVLKKVGITQIVAHPTLDKVRQGVIDGLAEAKFIDQDNIVIDYQNANGNIALASQIAKKFVGGDSNVIVAITTPSAQAAASATKGTQLPVVFATVTDPLKAGLVTSLTHPGGNITGTSNPSAIKQQLEFIKQTLPAIKNLGLIINYSEVNSVELLDQVKRESARIGITPEVATITNSSEVGAAAKSLVGKVQCVLLLQDNTVASSLPSLMKIMNAHNIPVFATFAEAVAQGAVASLAFDEYQIGIQTGKMVARILSGAKPGDMPVETPQKLELTINKKAAKKLGVAL